MAQYSDQRSQDLATLPIGKLLLQFALPSILAMSASAIYNFCDYMYLGQWVSSFALSGISIVLPITTVATAFGALTSVGGATQTSIYMGKDDRKTAQSIFGNVLLLTTIISVTFAAIGLLFLNHILEWFGASSVTLPYARQYLQIYLLGIFFQHTTLVMTAQMRSIGHPKVAMKAQVMAVILNFFLDPLFIYVFEWGIRGAALATVLSMICGWCFCIRFFRDKTRYVYLTMRAMVFNSDIVKKIVSIGISPFSINLCGSVVVASINEALLTQGGAMGDLCVGANGVCNRVSQLVILTVSGFAQGLQPIVGFNLGAGLHDRVIKSLKYALLVSSCVLTTGYIIITIFPAGFARIFTNDPDMIAICVPALRISLCTFPIIASQMIATTFFQAIRRPILSMVVSLSRQLLFLIPMLHILPPIMGLKGVWWSMPIADCFSVLLAVSLLWRECKRLQL